MAGRVEQWERACHGHSSDRVPVNASADHERWKQLTRWTHRSDRLPDTYRAIAGVVSTVLPTPENRPRPGRTPLTRY
ncbi:hypothetical protein AB0911_37620 [Streptomyces nigra]|uniref:hypothetical protein n=1 Tax=Streptomyces nigra TaxID=1827580 RepID=UPI00345387C9